MKGHLPLLLFIGITLSTFFIIDNIYYKDKVEFLSPIELGNLRIRHDTFGDGAFGTERRRGRIHKGLDISAPMGTPVRAAKGGWAVAKFDKGGYGRYVEIYHGGGLMTLYGHLKDTNIKWIRRVRQGYIIGWVGKTGNARYRSIKPHLHLEVRIDGVPVDPQGYLR